MTASGPIKVALLGCGTVGHEVARALGDPARAASLADAVGARLELVGVAVARPDVARDGVDAALLTADAASLATAGADVVVEVIGDAEGVRDLLTAAIDAGASVVTANKALLATHLADLTERAASRGVDLQYEAAVAGAIPVVRVLRSSLAGQRIERVLGIVNGTTNYILTTMASEGRGYGEVLASATELGIAERDPTADVEGHDAAQKAALLATLAFGREVTDADVAREGISRVTPEDLEAARRMGYVVRLLAVAERVGEAISVRVHPSMLPAGHPLASVSGASNAVFIEGPDTGPLMLRGMGAGGAPTATAVLGDVVLAARNKVRGTVERPPSISGGPSLLAPGEVAGAFYLAIEVEDRPGVLAAVATVFGDHAVSIRSMEQIGRHDDARLVFLTHRATESSMARTVDALGALDAVKARGVLLRVVDEEAR